MTMLEDLKAQLAELNDEARTLLAARGAELTAEEDWRDFTSEAEDPDLFHRDRIIRQRLQRYTEAQTVAKDEA